VELERGQKRWLHANKLRRYHARVNQALINNCSIIYDAAIAVLDDFPDVFSDKLGLCKVGMHEISSHQ